MRAFLWIATHTAYRVRVEGEGNLPQEGGALLVSNHVSFVDWLLVAAAADRPVRFLIGKDYYEKAWVKPFASVPRVIPIPVEGHPHEIAQALRDCGRAIQAGEVVCVFAEGGITRTGKLQPFRRGFESIMREVEAPIVPMALAGVWGSIFSFAGGKFLWKWPQEFPRVVTVNFGRSLPPKATPDEVRASVEKLLSAPSSRACVHHWEKDRKKD